MGVEGVTGTGAGPVPKSKALTEKASVKKAVSENAATYPRQRSPETPVPKTVVLFIWTVLEDTMIELDTSTEPVTDETETARVETPKLTVALETFTSPVTEETEVWRLLTATRPVTLETEV